VSALIRVKWAVEEMAFLADFYFNSKNRCIEDIDSELQRISRVLNKRADMLGIEHDDKFRNIAGIKMILENIRFVDEQGKNGLGNASAMSYYVVYMRKADRTHFNEILSEFNSKYGD